MLEHYEIIGVLGLLIESFAIYLLRIKKIDSHSLIFISMVTIGCVACLFTTYYDWNLICFIANSCWGIYNIYCFIRYYVMKNKNKNNI